MAVNDPIRRPVPDENESSHPHLVPSLVTGAVALGFAAIAPSAQAATVTVTNASDNGAGSLRDAIASANSGDVIAFDSTFFATNRTITLSSGQLEITKSLDIEGPTASTLTISGQDKYRVFYVFSDAETLDVTISHLVVTNGNSYDYGTDGDGGGIVDWGENLTLDHVTVQNSTTGSSNQNGGGVANPDDSGALIIRNSLITGNAAESGGGVYLYEPDSFELTDSQVTQNNADTDGGGVFLYYGDANSIVRTTIDGNYAGNNGGGVSVRDATLTITSSTISGNTAANSGGGGNFYRGYLGMTDSTVSGNQAQNVGGLYFYHPDPGTYLDFSTIANNIVTTIANSSSRARTTHATGRTAFQPHHPRARRNGENNPQPYGGVYVNETGILVSASSARTNDAPTAFLIHNSIVAGNTGYDVADGKGTITVTYSLIQNPQSGGLQTDATDKLNQDPLLGPLANNGGPTQTMLPASNSPVVDMGDPGYTNDPPYDQRDAGFPREVGSAVDMGAVETGTLIPAAVPALGTFGKMLLALTAMITGLFAIDRKRFLGVLFAATMVTAIAGSASAQMKPHHAGPHRGHVERATGVLDHMTRSGGMVTIVMKDGQSISAPASLVHVIDARSGHHRGHAVIASMPAGVNVTVTRRIRGDGTLRSMRVRFAATATSQTR